MQIERVYYQANYRRGDFLYENIGIGVLINEGEDAKQALDQAKSLCDEYHLANLPKEQPQPINEEKIIQSPKESAEIGVIAAINSCTELKVLETFQKLAKSKPEFQIAYDNQLKKLTNA